MRNQQSNKVIKLKGLLVSGFSKLIASEMPKWAYHSLVSQLKMVLTQWKWGVTLIKRVKENTRLSGGTPYTLTYAPE